MDSQKLKFCPTHTNEIINLVCLEINCSKENRVLCFKCIELTHKNHQIISIGDFGNLMKEAQNQLNTNHLDSLKAQINEQKELTLKRISNLQKYMCENIQKFQEVSMDIYKSQLNFLSFFNPQQLFDQQHIQSDSYDMMVDRIQTIYEIIQYLQNTNFLPTENSETNKIEQLQQKEEQIKNQLAINQELIQEDIKNSNENLNSTTQEKSKLEMNQLKFNKVLPKLQHVQYTSQDPVGKNSFFVQTIRDSVVACNKLEEGIISHINKQIQKISQIYQSNSINTLQIQNFEKEHDLKENTSLKNYSEGTQILKNVPHYNKQMQEKLQNLKNSIGIERMLIELITSNTASAILSMDESIFAQQNTSSSNKQQDQDEDVKKLNISESQEVSFQSQETSTKSVIKRVKPENQIYEKLSNKIRDISKQKPQNQCLLSIYLYGLYYFFLLSGSQLSKTNLAKNEQKQQSYIQMINALNFIIIKINGSQLATKLFPKLQKVVRVYGKEVYQLNLQQTVNKMILFSFQIQCSYSFQSFDSQINQISNSLESLQIYQYEALSKYIEMICKLANVEEQLICTVTKSQNFFKQLFKQSENDQLLARIQNEETLLILLGQLLDTIIFRNQLGIQIEKTQLNKQKPLGVLHFEGVTENTYSQQSQEASFQRLQQNWLKNTHLRLKIEDKRLSNLLKKYQQFLIPFVFPCIDFIYKKLSLSPNNFDQDDLNNKLEINNQTLKLDDDQFYEKESSITSQHQFFFSSHEEQIQLNKVEIPQQQQQNEEMIRSSLFQFPNKDQIQSNNMFSRQKSNYYHEAIEKVNKNLTLWQEEVIERSFKALERLFWLLPYKKQIFQKMMPIFIFFESYIFLSSQFMSPNKALKSNSIQYQTDDNQSEYSCISDEEITQLQTNSIFPETFEIQGQKETYNSKMQTRIKLPIYISAFVFRLKQQNFIEYLEIIKTQFNCISQGCIALYHKQSQFTQLQKKNLYSPHISDVCQFKDFEMRSGGGFPISIIIKAGEFYSHVVEVWKPVSIIHWAMRTQNHDLGFELQYIGDLYSDISTTKPIILIKVDYLDCHKRVYKGTFLANKPGIYKLIFNNKYSWFTHKNLRFKVFVLETTEYSEEIEKDSLSSYYLYPLHEME